MAKDTPRVIQVSMKKLFLYLSIPVLAAACTRFEEKDNSSGSIDIDNIPLEANQILCGSPSTKTSLDADLNVVWNESDEIEVFCGEHSATYRFSSYPLENDKRMAVFECDGAEKMEGEKSSIYPASAYVTGSYNGNTAKILLGGVTSPSDADDALSQDKDISALPLVCTPSAGTLSFENLFGGIVFRPYDYMGIGIKINRISVSAGDGRAIAGTATIDLATCKIKSFEGEEMVLTYTFPATDISKTGKSFTAYLPAGEYPQGITITILDNLNRKFPVNTGAMTIKPGMIKTLPELPLSIYYGNVNCIAVKPGTTSVSIDVTPRYTYRADYDITDGKPIRVENGNLSHYGKDAKVVWQQEANSSATDLTSSSTAGTIISGEPAVTFNDAKGNATLTVPLTGEAGNAVISICYNTTVAWSYHIWVGDHEDASTGGRMFLDRNLGATSVTPGDRDAYGVCYQWGRKDPFPRILTDSDSDVSGYRSHGDLLKTVNKSTGGTIAYTIKNPDTRITSSKSITCQNGDHWFRSGKNTALWGCNQTYSSSSDAKTKGNNIKTIFDPCPKGYKVPTYGDLTSIASGTTTTAVKGRTIDGSYFPYGGFIRLEESFLTSNQTGWMTDTRGYLWSAICRDGKGNEQGAYLLKYNKDKIVDNHNSNATDANGTGRGDQIFGFMCDAYPVRCVKETSSSAGSDSQNPEPPVLEEGEVLLNTVFEMNTQTVSVNSHAGVEKYSVLQPMYNNIFKLENSSLTAGVPSEQQKAHYPRLKRRKDGGVVLFYQGGSQSSRIFTMNAPDFNSLKTATPKIILTPYKDTELTAKYAALTGKSSIVYQRYMNMDAVVMPDGEIIAVAQHHAWDYKEVGYHKGEGTAIVLMRSTDGGNPRTSPKEIYSGTSWEPYLLLLPSGTLQMYFTDSNPFLYSSQTSVMTSADKGVSWSEKKVVARQYKYPYDGPNTDYTGQNVYTDQMPCFRLLNDGKTLAGFLEGRHEKDNDDGTVTTYHKMSLVTNGSTEWTAITGDSQNALPSTRNTNKMSGTGGYVETFPSGETLISCSSNGPFLIKILDSKCTVSDGILNIGNTWDAEKWFRPFGGIGVWGSMERYNDNILMATSSDGSVGLDVGLFYLNQQQNAPSAAIMLDGDNADWTNTKALFLSSTNGTELILRFAHDADYLYVLAESCNNGENEDIQIDVKKSSSYKASISLSAYSELAVTEGVLAMVRKGKTLDYRKGFCLEAAIPLSVLNASSGTTLLVSATVGGQTFTSNNEYSNTTWQRVKLL